MQRQLIVLPLSLVGCKMKIEMSKMKAAWRCQGYWFVGEKRQQHIITSRGLHFHTLAFMLLPTRLKIVLSPEFTLLFASRSLYFCVPAGGVLHIARDNLKWRRKESNQTEACFTWFTPFSVWMQADFFRRSWMSYLRNASPVLSLFIHSICLSVPQQWFSDIVCQDMN